MKIYAIYDRMIGYYQQPFIAHNDKHVLAALATTINSEDPQNAIAQAPHQFDLYEIATIEEDLEIKAEKKFITTLDSLNRKQPGLGGDRAPDGNGQHHQPTAVAHPARASAQVIGRTTSHANAQHPAPNPTTQGARRKI